MSIGRLIRKLDIDLINKIEGGWQPTPGAWKFMSTRSAGNQSRGRPGHQYRFFFRNKLKKNCDPMTGRKLMPFPQFWKEKADRKEY